MSPPKDVQSSPKREVPPWLRSILNKDVQITDHICKIGDSLMHPEKYRKYHKLLEISCHGLTWVAGTLAFMWIFWEPQYFQLQVNLVYGLIMEMFIIAIIKASVRRRRPALHTSDMFMTVGIDEYSFPSGHATRAIFLGYIFTYLHPINIFWRFFIYIWIAVICVSRVLMRRHHVLDIIGGIFIGIAEGFFMSGLWLSDSSSRYVVNFLSEESTTLEGLHDGFTEEL